MPSVRVRPDGYFEWLVDQTGCDDCWAMLNILYRTPFWSPVAMDGNRAEDGLYLRVLYGDSHDCTVEHLDGQCSMLEFLLGMADRVNHSSSYERDPGYWFRYFLENMRIDQYTDRVFEKRGTYNVEREIYERIDILLDRRYDFDGRNGGLFVVDDPPHDMRNAEYWWQMQYWLIENYRE